MAAEVGVVGIVGPGRWAPGSPRSRSRPATRSPPRRRRGRHRARHERASGRASSGAPAGSTSTPIRPTRGSTAASSACADAPTLADVAAGADLVIEAALEDLALEAGDLPRARRGRPGRRPSSRPTRARCRSRPSPPRRRARSASSACTSSTRPRSCRWSRSSPTPRPTRPSSIAPPRSMTAWGKDAGPLRATRPGFIVNRVNRPFTLEALRDARGRRGDASTAIDAAMRAAGFPMGPFELMDLIGIDVNLAAARGRLRGTRAAGDPLAERFRPSPIQERLVASGHLGRKTGAGFYGTTTAGRSPGRRPGSKPARPTPADADATRSSPTGSSLAIVNEAYRAARRRRRDRRPTSTSRCGSAPGTRSARSSARRRSAGPVAVAGRAFAACLGGPALRSGAGPRRAVGSPPAPLQSSP